MLTLKDIIARIRPLLTTTDLLSFSIDDKNNNKKNFRTAAAVLIIIHCKYGIPHILLTKRSAILRSHTSQISFPGGQFSPVEDRTFIDTALRETKEEIGLQFKTNDILGRLQSVDTLTSNFTLLPFITLQKDIPQPKLFTDEVESIIDIPLEETLLTISPDTENYDISQGGVYKFTYQSNIIWGATARILKQLYDCLCK
jgi:8-oxo-dGTP pyrophosphatase MutT (NUDIX family)